MALTSLLRNLQIEIAVVLSLIIIIQGHFVLTPLNNLLYNMDVDNLKQHGLHPRYLHLLVNTPMLYGPLAIGALSAVYGKFLEDHRDEFQQFYYGMSGIRVRSARV